MEELKGIKNIVSNSIKSFSNSERQMKEARNNQPNKLMNAIDSKREMDRQDREKELKKQNLDLAKRLEKNRKNQIWLSILCAIIGAGITVLLQKFIQ